MVGRVHLTKHISLDELRRRYRNEKNPRAKERLLAILHLYEGKTVKEVSKIIKRSVRSIERWAREMVRMVAMIVLTPFLLQATRGFGEGGAFGIKRRSHF